MKRLILINGTMGAGKTAVSRELLHIMTPAAFLDGDWCWMMEPFTVTPETRAMVVGNIGHVLRSFLNCSEYENVIFCWVMHQQEIIDDVLAELAGIDFELYVFTITVSAEALTRHIMGDVDKGVREVEVLERAVKRLALYEGMDTCKIDVSDIAPMQAALRIRQVILRSSRANG